MHEVQVFNENDDVYFQWMLNNPSGFVVNTGRGKKSSWFVLHRSECSHITSLSGLTLGAYTQRNFIKVCSNSISDLHGWFFSQREKFPGTFQQCKTCNAFSDELEEIDKSAVSPSEEEKIKVHFEGLGKTMSRIEYERNPAAKRKCLEYYGYRCSVCDFDFESCYGKLGKEFIHVHHKTPISVNKGRVYEVDPIKDLIPVCPNCHAMLHRRKEELYGIDELKRIIELSMQKNNKK